MKLLDERGIGTVWSICKEKFALAGHTHNYAGSGSPGGSANSAIGVVDYGQTDKTIQIGYSGTGITGDQIKYIAGYTDGSGNVNAKIKDVSKDALRAWLGLGSLAYSSSSIPTKVSQLTNDEGFITGYTLPTASDATLGGIKTGFTSQNNSIDWKVEVDEQGNAYTRIGGLRSSNKGRIAYIDIDGSNSYAPTTRYHNSGISSGLPTKQVNFFFPEKSGTFALESDLMKANYSGNISSNWAVKVDSDNNAYVPISGLSRGDGNIITTLNITSSARQTYYRSDGISLETEHDLYLCDFPTRGGTFALTSDCLTAEYVSSYPMGSDWRKIIYSSAQQIILLDESNGYDVSNWYEASEVGNVLDLYFCGAVGGLIQSDQSNLFKIADGSQLKSLNTINISPSKSYRLIRLREGVLVVAYSIPNIG